MDHVTWYRLAAVDGATDAPGEDLDQTLGRPVRITGYVRAKHDAKEAIAHRLGRTTFTYTVITDDGVYVLITGHTKPPTFIGIDVGDRVECLGYFVGRGVYNEPCMLMIGFVGRV